MATLKITQVVETTKEIEIEYPIYVKNKRKDEYTMFVDNKKGYRVIPLINCVLQTTDSIESVMEYGGTFIDKKEYTEMLEVASANFDLLYGQILQAQVKPMVKDECDQQADLEDAKWQDALENYLNK